MNAVWQLFDIDLSSGRCFQRQVTYEGTAWVRRDLIPDLRPGEDDIETRGVAVDVIVEFDDDDECIISAEFPNGLKDTGLELAHEIACRCFEEGLVDDSPAVIPGNVFASDLIADARKEMFE